ncbi:hypothetical protein ACFVWG_01905 [Kribbella sp. NPDC058245]|uniref:hypothetical protein n=1 Tax=Kribbella sp. NPDC058245 TaxID=3346399 RepID=UPI0036EC695A
MNLQNLRDELTTRADEAADRQPDLLPGVRDKIRRTKQRRTATAVASVAALAALAVAIVPGVINTSTPDPADEIPQDYTKNGQTVPGMVNGDKLLKAWIADPGQSKFSFAWTPTTDKIAVYVNCDDVGFTAPTEVRITVGGFYAGNTGCQDVANESSTTALGVFLPDSALWLTTPLGKATTVSAEVVESVSGKPQKAIEPIRVGIYSTTEASRVGGAVAPAPGPDDFQQNGIFYRKKIGGDTLLGAGVAERGSNELRFKFTSDGSQLKLRPFCTANNGPVNGNAPYMIQIKFNGKLATEMTCTARSLDAGTSDTVAGEDRAPVGQEVEVVAQLIPTDQKSPPLPTDGYLALGVYAQGPKRVVGGVSLDEQIEVGGITYRLDTVKSAPGPAKRVEIDTPADRPFVLAYGGTSLGKAGPYTVDAQVGTATAGGMGIAANSGDDLGLASTPIAAGPTTKASMFLTEGKPTGGTLVIAIYLPD